MTDATFNLNNYTDEEVLDLFGISKEDCQNKDKIYDQYNTIVKNIKTQNEFTPDFKTDLVSFLSKALKRMIDNVENKDYKISNSNFTPDLVKSETFNNDHHIIKPNNKKSLTSLINPIRTDRISKLLNINTVFRDNYYNTKSSEFSFTLPAPINNVIGVSLETAEIDNTYYAFNQTNYSNEFTVEVYDIQSTNNIPIDEDPENIQITNKQKKVIKIKEGNYSGQELSDYLNKSIFSDNELARIACKYNANTKKFCFFRDNRDHDEGGLPDTQLVKYCFNLDFRIEKDVRRDIQKNMGWLLGFRKQTYYFDDDYITLSNTTTTKGEGFECEATCSCRGTPYIYVSIDCFNNNHTQSIISPFSESAFNDTNILAKLKNRGSNFNYESGGLIYGFKRDYFGPVTVSKMKIRLLDQYGDVIDLHNNDYSFTLKFDQMYNLNINYSTHFD
tara:strand:- start:345 stop:1679 length:1335 start_codon:yes stop_codon:yes gene_type:complete